MDDLSQLLHQCGFTWEDFPESARTNPGLLRCVHDLPKELRAECLDALRDFLASIRVSMNRSEHSC